LIILHRSCLNQGRLRASRDGTGLVSTSGDGMSLVASFALDDSGVGCRSGGSSGRHVCKGSGYGLRGIVNVNGVD